MLIIYSIVLLCVIFLINNYSKFFLSCNLQGEKMLRQLRRTPTYFKNFINNGTRSLCIVVDQKPIELKKHNSRKFNHPTVAEVFANLKDENNSISTSISAKTDLDDIISNAKTVNGLLNIADTSKELKRKHALKIVSILAEWTTIQRAKLEDFGNRDNF